MEFRILGPMEVRDDERAVPLGGTKQRAVLAMLLLRAGHNVSVEQLIDGLWGEEPPETAPATIQVYVSQLRKAFDPGRELLVREGPGYALRLPDGAGDLSRFEEAVAKGRGEIDRGDPAAAARVLDQALALWRGEALAEFAGMPFAGPEAARLDDLLAGAWEERMEVDLVRGRHDEALPELERLIERWPLRERFRGQLMLAAYRSGRQEHALEVYRRTRTLLADELGIDPSPALQELHGAILAQDPSLAAPAKASDDPHNIPASITSFVGREHDLEALGAALAAGTRLLTLTGPGGTGKTRLSLELARASLGSWPGGVWFVDLAPLADPALVPTTIAAAIPLDKDPTAPILDGLVAAIGAAKTLIVLDNCEHVLAAAAAAASSLLATAPEVTVVATSRERLGLTGETIWAVQPLTSPDREDAAVWETDAARLFLDRARAVAPDLQVADSSAGPLAAICRDLDGLPLALELAAARCASMSLTELASALADRFSLLRTDAHGAAPRQRTLGALVDWSFELLDDQTRALFSAFSVFAGPTDLAAIAAIALDGDDEAARGLVASLAAKSLLVVERGEEQTRFRMLETLRLYASTRLIEAGDADLIRRTHAEYFTTVSERARADASAGNDLIEHNLANLRAAMDWAAVHDSGLELRLVNGMTQYWRTKGSLQEGRERSLAAIARADGEPTRILALALLSAGTFTYTIGNYNEARMAYGRCAEVAREIGFDHALAVSLNAFGGLASQDGDLPGAREHFGAALAIFERGDDVRAQALVLNNLASVLARLGDIAGALTHLGRSVALLADTPDSATPLTSRADLFRLIGDHAAARNDNEEALRIARETGSRMIEGANLIGLAMLEPDLAVARPMMAEGIQIMRELDVRELLGEGLTDAAELALADGDIEIAMGNLREALELHRRRGDRYAIAATLLTAARVEAARDEHERAAFLLSASDALRAATGAVRHPLADAQHADLSAVLARSLDEAARTAAAERGAAVSEDDAALGKILR